jgi:hypothetical protein
MPFLSRKYLGAIVVGCAMGLLHFGCTQSPTTPPLLRRLRFLRLRLGRLVRYACRNGE